VPSYYVDLGANEDPLKLCSSNTRSQLRRSNRLLDEMGATFERADSRTAAREYLEQLIPLHQEYWQAQDHPGSFSDEAFVGFHREAIDRFFPDGSIYLARLRSGTEVLGVVYGFLTGGRFHFYQSGLKRLTDNRIKLGYSLHYLAMCDLRKMETVEYDFLAGVERYKSCWGGVRRTMVWARLQRPLLRLAIERSGKELIRKMRRAPK
jgi:CelD/BcsL family acetyltransferase involved in cellulose biosynthesis